jgi:sucrose phosphorylase
MLDCHDGIPVQPDLDGILDSEEMLWLADLVQRRGGNVNRILSESHADGGVDVHQLNCTYYSALDGDDDRYLAARAIQLFARGVPQIYYVGLLAGENDHLAVSETGEGRAINRHDYSTAEVDAAISRPVVQRVLDLVRLRNSHPAFTGYLEVSSDGPSSLRMTWHRDDERCELSVDLASGEAIVTARQRGQEEQRFAITKGPLAEEVEQLAP